MAYLGRELVIETATAACSVALIENGVVVAEIHEVVGRGHAERLIPMIAELPGGGRADAIRVDCGPGSFTGVRVGLAAARALGLGWGVPVTGFSSLALIAADIAPAPATLSVAIGGGHGELFVQRFTSEPLHPLGDIASLKPEAAAAMLPDDLVAGSAAEAVVQLRGTGEARAAEARAANLIRLPADLIALPPTPIYGRAPDARPPG
ncbi:tRNA threonylcarbamoyl adenosine modification protein YeaZ [Sphingomonas laterariae]|uniref:tRNA threonylcarbamoyl adenosine modification protein YeaZ n=1 Tax=Edaphosphingomonas laterariae TaxID=861865 RepID=A0A239BCU0_9SPHN|nr:tRNA (adenosine(37)-N6)-threonylcarbamoyltransferase complex dimerization subunit type 1 TsaB [Sphingomonas laterariae]SNS05835.1 tRNA threonylcarbamoyl adenosine modification protein YeaZ [Sphingomonas laterariae]